MSDDKPTRCASGGGFENNAEMHDHFQGQLRPPVLAKAIGLGPYNVRNVDGVVQFTNPIGSLMGCRATLIKGDRSFETDDWSVKNVSAEELLDVILEIAREFYDVTQEGDSYKLASR